MNKVQHSLSLTKKKLIEDNPAIANSVINEYVVDDYEDLRSKINEYLRQINISDEIILNKTKLIKGDAPEDLAAKIKSIWDQQNF